MDTLGVDVIGGMVAFEIVLIVDEFDIDDAFAFDAPILYRLLRYIFSLMGSKISEEHTHTK